MSETVTVTERSRGSITPTPIDLSSISSLLDDPEMPIENLLRERFIVSAFKSGFAKLNAYLSNDCVTRTLVSVFVSSCDRVLVNVIANLFLSPNELLMQKFLRETEILESFCDVLTRREPAQLYSIGLFIQIVTAAASKYRKELYELLYRSHTFWPALLAAIDLDAVASGVNQLMQGATIADNSFLWQYFLAMCPTRSPNPEPPAVWSLAVRGRGEVHLTSRHRSVLFQLFRSCLLSFPDERGFAAALANELPNILPTLETPQEISALFNLAACLREQPAVTGYALDLIVRCPIEPSPAVESAILYLNEFFDSAHGRPITFFLFTLFCADQMPPFIYLAARTLIETVLTYVGSDCTFLTCMQHGLAFAWNRKGMDCSVAKRAFLLDVADRLGPLMSFDGWAIFMGAVVRHYRRQLTYPVNFEIPESGMDPTLSRMFEEWPQSSELLPDLKPRRHRRASVGDGSVLGVSRSIVDVRRRSESFDEELDGSVRRENLRATMPIREFSNDPKKKCAVA
jgi:hypothetical protein